MQDTEKEREKAYADYVCKNKGHVWVETDSGLLYSRHSGRDAGTVSVFCRHCGITASFQTRGKATAKPPVSSLVNEYRDVPKFRKIATIAVREAEAAKQSDPLTTGTAPMQ